MASDLLPSLSFVAVEIGFFSPFSFGHGFATFILCPDSLVFSPSTCWYLVVVLFLFKAAYPIVQLAFYLSFFFSHIRFHNRVGWIVDLLTFHAMCRTGFIET